MIIVIVITVTLIKLLRALHNLQLDIADPQVSRSIADSKKARFFLSEFKLHNSSPKYFKVKEAWVEYIWYNSIIGDKPIKKKVDHLQLALKLSNFKNISDSFFLINWELEAKDFGYVAMSGNVCTFSLDSLVLPKSKKIFVENRDSLNGEFRKLDSFYLVKY